MAISLSIEDLGIIDYQTAWDLQRKTQSALIAGSENEAFLYCSHNPVLTYGSSSELSKVLLTKPENLASNGIQLIKSDRGGNITFHAPGQLVCYFIIDLKKRRQDVAWYLRSLEQGIVELLQYYKIEAFTLPSKTGVWISQCDKICSIGIRISRWCTMHGLAINISEACELGFKDIIPCGITDARATSIESLIGQIPLRAELIGQITKIFTRRFFRDFDLSYMQLQHSA